MVGSDMSSSTGKGGGALKATHVGDSLINNHDALPIAGGGGWASGAVLYSSFHVVGRLGRQLGHAMETRAHPAAHRGLKCSSLGVRRYRRCQADRAWIWLIVNSKKPRRTEKRDGASATKKMSNMVNSDICLSVFCRDGFLH